MRPAGEIRVALERAFEQQPGTSRELAQRACVGLQAARMTLDNMCRAGAAAKLAAVRVPGVSRPVPVYGPPPPIHPASCRSLHELEASLAPA